MMRKSNRFALRCLELRRTYGNFILPPGGLNRDSISPEGTRGTAALRCPLSPALGARDKGQGHRADFALIVSTPVRPIPCLAPSLSVPVAGRGRVGSPARRLAARRSASDGRRPP